MGKTLFGLIILLFGVLFLLSNIGIIDFNPGMFFATFWPVILILYGLKELLHRHLVNGVAITLIGTAFLLNRFDLISLSLIWNILWPLAIIYFGIRILFGNRRLFSSYSKHGWDEEDWGSDHLESIRGDESVFAGSVQKGMERETWQLDDTDITMFAGEIRLDLSTAIIPERETRLTLRGFAGEITIYVPEDLPICADSWVFAGEINIFNKEESGVWRELSYTSGDYDFADKKLRIKARVVAGEINIKRVH